MTQKISTKTSHSKAVSAGEQVVNQSPELPDEDGPIWLAFAGGSLVLHILIIVSMIFLPQMVRSKTPNLPYLDITLEALPTIQPGAPGPKAVEETPKPKVQPLPKKEPEPKPDPVEPLPKVKKPEPVKTKTDAPKAVKQAEPVKNGKAAEISTAKEKAPDEIPVLTSMKKRTYKVDVAKEKALREIKEKVETGRPSSVEEAIKRLRENPGERPTPSGIQGGGGGRPIADKVEMLRQQHIQEVGDHIKTNWAMPEKFIASRLETWVAITIHSNGNITNIWFEKRSGDKYFDDSTERAVKKSIPTLPFPKDLEKTPFDMVVKFQAPDQ